MNTRLRRARVACAKVAIVRRHSAECNVSCRARKLGLFARRGDTEAPRVYRIPRRTLFCDHCNPQTIGVAQLSIVHDSNHGSVLSPKTPPAHSDNDSRRRPHHPRIAETRKAVGHDAASLLAHLQVVAVTSEFALSIDNHGKIDCPNGVSSIMRA